MLQTGPHFHTHQTTVYEWMGNLNDTPIWSILGLKAEGLWLCQDTADALPSYHIASFVTILQLMLKMGTAQVAQQSKMQLSTELASSWELRRICSMPLSQLLVVAGKSRNLLKSHSSYFCFHCHMCASMSLCLCVSSLLIRIPVILG